MQGDRSDSDPSGQIATVPLENGFDVRQLLDFAECF